MEVNKSSNSISSSRNNKHNKYYVENNDHVDNNNTEGIEKLQFKQIKNKRRSKTPLRKKVVTTTRITNITLKITIMWTTIIQKG